MKVLCGTSGYSFKEWKGNFYPADLHADAMLGYYAGKFSTVEINNTFYRLPKTHVLEEWAAQTPATFTFTLKASQRITHFARLKPESADAVGFLLKTTAVLGDRLGAILFQLPPNLKKDLGLLHGFLELLPPDRRYAFEFRHDSWFDESTFRLLRDRDIAMCVAEQDDFKCPVVCTARSRTTSNAPSSARRRGDTCACTVSTTASRRLPSGRSASAVNRGRTPTCSSSMTTVSAPGRRSSRRS
jgi:uncharacterized protein YecE (DUF72 family)